MPRKSRCCEKKLREDKELNKKGDFMRLFHRDKRIPIQGKTIFSAHRGLSSQAPENTIPAFEAAVKAGFGAVECDVWETGGEMPELMILHDENLKRMCGVNIRIGSASPQEIKKYPIKNGSHIKAFQGLTIPFFEDYLRILSAAGAMPMIEIKAGKSGKRMSQRGLERLAEQFYTICGETEAVIQSFDMETLQEFRQLRKPKTQLFLLTKKTQDLEKNKLLEYKEKGIGGISLKYTLCDHLQEIKAYGLKTAIWTVDRGKQAFSLSESGNADYIISNKKLFI